MSPFIKALDVCISPGTPPSRIKAGDIVVHENTSDGKLAVRRVLRVDKNKKYVLLKGDNMPYEFSVKVRVPEIKDKVVSIKRGEKIFDLEKFPHAHVGKILALLSRYDLTPLLFKKRFIDPFLLGISRNPLYVFFRKPFYKDISFMNTRDKTRCYIYAFVRKGQSAKAVLELKENKGIFMSCYIRHRDRNPLFVNRFIRKVIEIVDKEYGPQYKLYIIDQKLKKFISPTGSSFYSDRIRFL